MVNVQNYSSPSDTQRPAFDAYEISLLELLQPVRERWRLVACSTLLAAAAGFGVASLLPKWYTARTVMLPPQQQQSAAAAAVSQLGALAGLAGNLGNIKSPADQYVALMQSATVGDRLVDQFKLMDVYETKFRVDARKELAANVRISAGKRDGLLTIEVDDLDPQRAADIANAHVDALRHITTQLAVTEAQQRRVFFEEQMKEARERLTQSQMALAQVGIGEGVLKAEPRSAAEGYAKLKAETTAAEVRLQTLRSTLADSAPQVAQQEAQINALQQQLRRAEAQNSGGSVSSDYITKYRNFKYEEALFEIFAKQYELARLDESREGALIQVVDRASAPERKAGPKRIMIAALSALLVFSGCAAWLISRRIFKAI